MTTRLAALATALDAGSGRFFDPSTTQARAVLDRAGARLEHSLEHTVVALAGATGSGKSSLFNALCGMGIARVGVRRPTTSRPLACVWGISGAEALLDWLDVPDEGRVSRESVLDSGASDALDGLVLLDLPDHDSTEADHQRTVDRLVDLVDLFIWVMDPQKYADEAVHERYLRGLSAHDDVTVVVLNQIDRLRADDVDACLADLRRLLDDDGLTGARLYPVSAVTGAGVDELLELLRDTVAKRLAIRERIEADTRRIALRMEQVVGSAAPGELGPGEHERLVDGLAAAAEVDQLATAAGRMYLRRGRAAQPPEPPVIDEAVTTPVVEEYGTAAVGSLSAGWGGSIRAAATEAAADVPDQLVRELAELDLRERPPRWWQLTGAVEWLAILTGVVGGGWALLVELRSRFEWGWLDRLDIAEPEVIGSPVSLVLLVTGGVVALVLAVVRYLAARRARRRRADEARAELRAVVDRVATNVVEKPVGAELDRYRTFREALADAAAD
ncbi:GTPase family protein [Phytoactinopolyspora limicola]|uniref:GTPase family protein n=1 Tax=Phytoactinopolyspora limicola TaxID=2715536 RepID=UPI00140E7E0C|nr:GTPase [Phytoactinopolyspora limicola]